MDLHQLVGDSARRDGDALAVSGPTGELRYRELDLLSGRLAHRLAELGVGAGDRVVIWADKSAETVAAMQAVLRLGAAYVPVNAATPVERVRLILTDCAARALCVDTPRAQEVPLLGTELGWLDLARPQTGTPSRPAVPVHADDLAFILYTSGSTGTPKGVCISHANARAFVDWAVDELKATAADRFANHAPFAFDLSVLDLYAAFAVGASVHLVPPDLAYAPARLTDFLHERRISVWYSVPTALILMLRDGGLLDRPAPTDLRAVLFAGEPFPIDHLRALAGWTPARLLNLYGPTETNVCTFHEVRPSDLERDRPVPIGRAASGDTVRVETADGAPAAPGQEGELVVEGPTVMLGYWGRPRPAGPYRTGDIVRQLADGTIEFLGRRDHTVKVRGNRVDLGEVETVLCAHPGVEQAAVVVAGSGPESRLVAFAVPVPDDVPTVLSVKRHCARRLPPYMIIDELRLVAHLPRTDNGKIDRLALTRATSAADDAAPTD
ncbi:amino acid adenylation domain-containing protein [Kitasatospora sp. NPDC092286]|uniref:amino acid adenylation domain-containing protein n=1 Tax=Kitasatospora sp. NPDC092286 TaxID=3364087 RepID=UPI0037F93D38